MSTEETDWNSEWTVEVRVWVEREGQTILGKGRLELLEAIDRWRSISAAARQMSMSYRRAWLLVQDINRSAGEALVEAAVGGSHGGGARLTTRGRQAVSAFRALQTQVRGAAARFHPRHLHQLSGPAVHLAAAVSLEEVLGQLLSDFALLEPTIRVRTLFGASDELADQLLSGAAADLFLPADVEQLDRLEAAGLLIAASRVDLAENTLAAVGPAEREVQVRAPADLLHPDIRRVALAGPNSPLGRYTRAYLEGTNLYAPLQERALFVDHSGAVIPAVHAGQADIGLVYGSDAALATDCRVLFRARRAQPAIRYAAALLRQSQVPEQARVLLQFFLSTKAARRFRRCGFLAPRDGSRARS